MGVPVTYRALVLFDIDGTLVRRAGPHHRQALVEGVRRVTGLETTTDGIPVQGMLDPDILTMMLRAAGAPRPSIRESMPAILRAAERYYLRACPALTHRPAAVLHWRKSAVSRRDALPFAEWMPIAPRPSASMFVPAFEVTVLAVRFSSGP